MQRLWVSLGVTEKIKEKGLWEREAPSRQKTGSSKCPLGRHGVSAPGLGGMAPNPCGRGFGVCPAVGRGGRKGVAGRPGQTRSAPQSITFMKILCSVMYNYDAPIQN